jgi:hypothetical protein
MNVAGTIAGVRDYSSLVLLFLDTEDGRSRSRWNIGPSSICSKARRAGLTN